MASTIQDDQIVLVRGSEEHKEYMRHQGGWLKTLVARLESDLATAGRVLLLLFLIYTTVKTGLDRMGVAVPIWLEIVMLALQVAGVEGAVPGLSRQKADLLAQGKTEEANEIGGAISSTRILAVLTGVEIGLAMIAEKAPNEYLSWTLTIYSIVLLLARLWLITKFLIAMAKIEQKGPKIISQAEYNRQHEEKLEKEERASSLAADVLKLKDQMNEINSSFQSVGLSIERHFQQIERQLTERLKEHTGEMKAFQLKEIQALAETLYRVEEGFNETLLPAAENLVALPAFSEQLQQIETTVTQHVTQLQGALQANTQPRLPAVSTTRTIKTETRRVATATKGDFDREAFVEACLQEDSEMPLSTMSQKAAALGFSLSIGSASTIRRAISERQGVLSASTVVDALKG